jgi:hypothetical protein
MIAIALALAATLAAPVPTLAPDRAAHPEIVAPRPVPTEMTPAPGHWEIEDAPAYFSSRREGGETARDISRVAATPVSEATDPAGNGSAGAPAEDGSHDVALGRDIAAVPLPRPRGLAAPAARPRR